MKTWRMLKALTVWGWVAISIVGCEVERSRPDRTGLTPQRMEDGEQAGRMMACEAYCGWLGDTKGCDDDMIDTCLQKVEDLSSQVDETCLSAGDTCCQCRLDHAKHANNEDTGCLTAIIKDSEVPPECKTKCEAWSKCTGPLAP